MSGIIILFFLAFPILCWFGWYHHWKKNKKLTKENQALREALGNNKTNKPTVTNKSDNSTPVDEANVLLDIVEDKYIDRDIKEELIFKLLFEWSDDPVNNKLWLRAKKYYRYGEPARIFISPSVGSNFTPHEVYEGGELFYIDIDKRFSMWIKSPKNGIASINSSNPSGVLFTAAIDLNKDKNIISIDYSEENLRERHEIEDEKDRAYREMVLRNEKAEIKEKLLEKQRKRDLEKQITQELIEDGKLFPEANKRPPIPRELVDAIWNRDKGQCVYCGSNENIHIDHIIPFSKGGATCLENLQLLCEKCNLQKSDKIG